MIRKIVLFLLSLIGGALLFYGCVGRLSPFFWDDYNWEYRPQDFPINIPQGWISIGFGRVAGGLRSPETQTAGTSKETFLFNWLDKTCTSKDGVAYRLRLLIIWPISLVCLGVLLLTYPMLAFIRGPYRRFYRRRNGCCDQCGYNLTGNISGVCPECGKTIDPNWMNKISQQDTSNRWRWATIGVFVGIVVLSIVPPRLEFGQHLPVLIKNPILVMVAFGLLSLARQRVWLVGKDLAWFFLVFVMIYLVCYFIF